MTRLYTRYWDWKFPSESMSGTGLAPWPDRAVETMQTPDHRWDLDDWCRLLWQTRGCCTEHQEEWTAIWGHPPDPVWWFSPAPTCFQVHGEKEVCISGQWNCHSHIKHGIFLTFLHVCVEPHGQGPYTLENSPHFTRKQNYLPPENYCCKKVFYPFHSWAQKVYSSNLSKSNCMSDVARICSTITFNLSKLWKVKFSILCDVIFLVILQGNFDIDHSQEWKGCAGPSSNINSMIKILVILHFRQPVGVTAYPAQLNLCKCTGRKIPCLFPFCKTSELEGKTYKCKIRTLPLLHVHEYKVPRRGIAGLPIGPCCTALSQITM